MSQVVSASNPTRVAELELVPSEDGCIIYEADKDRVHYLNPIAVLIFELCTGQNTTQEIINLVGEAFELDQPPVKEVSEALARMKAEGLLN